MPVPEEKWGRGEKIGHADEGEGDEVFLARPGLLERVVLHGVADEGVDELK